MNHSTPSDSLSDGLELRIHIPRICHYILFLEKVLAIWMHNVISPTCPFRNVRNSRPLESTLSCQSQHPIMILISPLQTSHVVVSIPTLCSTGPSWITCQV